MRIAHHFLLLILITVTPAIGQNIPNMYEPSPEKPYGSINPQANEALQDYAMLIGLCDCESKKRNQDGSWTAPIAMTWEFKYIMNGMAVQDQTLKANGIHSGSIRQYNADSATWYVHYYSTASAVPQLATWTGGSIDDDIILLKKQNAPNGAAGNFKISFTDITEDGFNWLGEWVSMDESIHFPTWQINCIKRK